jgi:2-polyprenyl-3-methyl-5-hydroxy-6-metoxy-1,4-benzoquinol methylase
MTDQSAKGSPEPSPPSWSDNDGVAVLRSLAESVSALAEAAPPRRDIGAASTPSPAELPIQDLPAHIRFARIWEQRRAAVLTRRQARLCPLCGADGRRPWFATQDGYEYDICDRCTMVHIPAVVPLRVWDEYFNGLPEARTFLRAQMEGTITAAALEANRARFGRYFSLLGNYGVRLSGARLLDVGTHTGGALKIAGEFGIDPAGVEGLREAVDFVHEHRPELRVALGHAEDLDATAFGGRFDLITMWETLEHTIDPLKALAHARAALAPGGVVMVSVPNARNIQFSMLREYCFFAYGGYQGIGHVNLFTPDTLRRAFEASGFQLLHLETEFGTDWRQIAYYLQHRFNRIYCYQNLVRQDEFMENPEPELALVLNWLSPALTKVENALLAGPIMLALAKRT